MSKPIVDLIPRQLLNLLISNFKSDDISRYRQALMGVAIFGVMFSHWFGFQSIKTGFPFDISVMIVRLVFTEGLLFLSGFGLYYSYSKNSNVKAFYKRRIFRLYLPFLILSFPLYTFFLFVRDGYGPIDYLSQLTTTYFWLKGNYGGMWYVSISVVLYILFPCIFGFIFQPQKQGHIWWRFLFSLVIFYTTMFVIRSYFGDYYSLVKIGVEKIPFFLLGIMFAYMVKDEKISDKIYLVAVCVVACLYLSLTGLNYILPNPWIKHFIGITQKLFFMPILCFVFNLLNVAKLGVLVISFFRWFGKYSLELYVLHLHIYMFFQYSFLNEHLSSLAQASLAMLFAIILCYPVNRGLSKIIDIIKNGNSYVVS